jgi:BirA family biotin operon repressor/biotin-[acetyl-CoA-carboxylase] ligase
MTRMQIAYEVLRQLNDGKFHSGTLLAQQLKVSRSSIWKAVTFLRALEVPIQAVTSKGYRWVQPLELLNRDKIFEYLDATLQPISRIDVVNVIPSTNDYLMQRLSHGMQSPTVCTAEGQTAGRGRMGREWRSPLGANIYFSLYWRFAHKIQELSGLSLVVGLAALEALQRCAPLPAGVGIKWPNDIWYQGEKLAGILIESAGTKSGDNQAAFTDVVIGIGINVNMISVKKGIAPWTDLHSIWGFLPSRNQLIGYLLNSLIAKLSQFEREGFPIFIPEWTQYDLLAGKKVDLSIGNTHQEGTAQGVNDRGELTVRVGNTLKAIRYGEISVKPDRNDCANAHCSVE